MLIAIAAVDKNLAIGYNNKLLFHIPEDMKFFKVMTSGGHVVIMGRNTFDSLNDIPLKDRINLVVSNNPSLKLRDDIISGNINETRKFLNRINTPDNKIYVIGGSSIYKEFIDDYDYILLTQYEREYDKADAYFPNPSEYGYNLVEVVDSGTFEGYNWSICMYSKNK